ncbi:MAG: hypothetical protein GQE15_08740 [Archangiaceae bacterium]|nr:hypothetical protein [Archangiaceae bacterium]
MKSALRVAAFALVASSCFSPVGEAQCSTDADCTNGTTCIDFRCRGPEGSAGGSAGGGAASAGGVATAGGDAGGAAVGGGASVGGGTAGGGVMVAGGAAGGGMATCGCRSGATGQCQPGDSPLACGSSGGTCTRCGNGEQCVNGSCVMAACGPGTCSGCCARGFCVAPSMQSTVTCGSAGGMCTQCARGQDCINGTCQQAMGCSAMTCASGCCIPGANRCLPPNQQNRFTCGTGGAQCAMCPGGNGAQCNNGVCVGTTTDAGMPNGCDAVSCANGCCAFGRCLPTSMQSNFTCGIAGNMCSQCNGGTSCQSGVCTPNTTADGGMVQVMPTGSACTAMTTCEGLCLEATQFGQSTGYPGGYCTANCGNGTACTSGICVTESVFGQPVSNCRATCTGSGQGSCRTGYVCVPSPASTASYCRPNCNNGGLAMCTSGQCQPNGFCM